MNGWQIEVIPDSDELYYRIPKGQAGKGIPQPGHFRESGGSISADWSKYSTAAETRARQGMDRASTFGVITIPVGGARHVEGLSVIHEPDIPRQNRAHSGIYGMDTPVGAVDLARKERIRLALYQLVKGWTISPNDPVVAPEAASGG